MRRRTPAFGLAIVAAVTLSGSVTASAASGGRDFVGTWAASPMVASTSGPSVAGLSNQTERAMVRTSIGGNQLRVRISNAFGAAPVTFEEVDVAVRAAGASVVAGTSRRLRFDARSSATVPTGREIVSDPLRFTVKPGQDLAISLFAKGSTGPATFHALATSTSYESAPGSGDHAADRGGAAFTSTIGSWLFVDGVDVTPPSDPGAIVTFGDSITDGFQSTIDANRRWPDFLARRLQALPAGQRKGVLNQGITGNRLLLDSPIFGVKALDRLDRDVLDQTGATDVIVLLGINDIGQTPHQFDANAIIAALRQVADRSHDEGLRVFGGTLLPFKNTTIAGYYTPQGDATRLAVNQWIRTSGAFDAVIDFDRITRSQADPLMLNPALDSGDHLHPNDLGYQTMANAIDLNLFRGNRD
jgi:lysophospholipase L1-like esterase